MVEQSAPEVNFEGLSAARNPSINFQCRDAESEIIGTLRVVTTKVWRGRTP
jgi:hypothetical protein